MGLPLPAFKYLLLVGLIVALLYARMILNRRRPRELHGRDRWRADFRQRRHDRLTAAGTWEERRRIRQQLEGPRRIRFRIEPGGAAREAGAKPAEPERNGLGGGSEGAERSGHGGEPEGADRSAHGGES